MLEKYLLRDFLQKLPSWLRHFYTLVVVFVGWGVFAMENLTVCAGYFKTCFGSGTLWSAADGYYLTAYGLTLLLLTVGSTRLPRKVWDRLPERARALLGPLLMAAGLGLAFCVLAFVGIMIVVVRALMFGDPTSGWPSLVCIILLCSGVQLLCTGIAGEYLAKTYLETKHRPIYIAAETEEDLDAE